jgi:hypothetical protein
MAGENSSVTQQEASKNEIDHDGVVGAGMLFIIFIVLPIMFLIGLWPDRLPEHDYQAYYRIKLFHVRLMESGPDATKDSGKSALPTAAVQPKTADTASKKPDTTVKADTPSKKGDTPVKKGDTSRVGTQANQDKKVSAAAADTAASRATDHTAFVSDEPDDTRMHLNILLMLLVAIAGFMGTMIHIATSFTNFVGAEKYKRSWGMWYFVKPALGAALAIIFYFVFRAGLLNFNDPRSINLFGLITLAALTGLFADKASIKLEEFFNVVFKPKDERPDKLKTPYKFTATAPESIDLDKENTWVISGEHLKDVKFKVLLNDKPVPFSQADNNITIRYTPTEEDKKLQEFKLVILDEDNIEAYKAVLKSSATTPADQQEPDDDSVG